MLNDNEGHPLWKDSVDKANNLVILYNYLSLCFTGAHRYFPGSKPLSRFSESKDLETYSKSFSFRTMAHFCIVHLTAGGIVEAEV